MKLIARRGAIALPASHYNRDYWTAFDADNNGYLDSNEYWSAAAWARMDRNGRVDSDEWRWW